MLSDFEQKLEKYAEVILKVGVNLQPGQRLLIGGPTVGADGVPLEAAPLVRIIAKKAYQMGARLVDVVWGDEQLRLLRFQNASKDSIKEYPKWRIQARYDISKAGDAHVIVFSPNPELLKGVEPDLISKFQTSFYEQLNPVSELLSANAFNWLVVSVPNSNLADKLFPNFPKNDRINKFWDIIFEICRINREDPITAWQTHNKNLSKRCKYLNEKQYVALKLTAPGTDLMIGLPNGHIWEGGSVIAQNGIEFTANIPTEEVFTMPHKDKVEGFVSTSKPVFYGGVLIENCRLTFSKGQIIEASAEIGEGFLLKTLETDEGARKLGEVALVPHSSPISQSGLIFYNMLIDENASNHIALGRAYRESLKGGDTLTDEEFLAAGGNNSLIHLDFMIGTGDMNVDGILEDKTVESIMKNGEWAFDV
ncbi:MAG: aminopeptidase [Promethearchaeota archaeon]